MGNYRETIKKEYPDDPEKVRAVLHYVLLTHFGVYQGIKYQGDDYCFVGVPVTGESGGVFMSSDLRFAMSSQSEHKEGAWEFMRFMLNPENQQAAERIPVIQRELDRRIDALVDNVSANDFGEVDFNQSDADKLRGLIESTTAFEIDDDTIYNIIYGEAAVYFSGDRSAEEAARIIQDRLTKYVAERK